MPFHKVRLEVYNAEGDKYTITFQGRITREKTTRLLDLVEVLGGSPEYNNVPRWAEHKAKLTKFDRVRFVVETHFPLTWFSAKYAQSIYTKEFNTPIRLSRSQPTSLEWLIGDSFYEM